MDQPATDSVPTSEPLRLFLADRDAPCPGCGYNLRGIEEGTCPECGRVVELTIARPGRGRGYLLFVLLALGWVLVAGSMNSWRTWREARQQAQPASQWITFSNTISFTTSGSVTAGGGSAPGATRITLNRGGQNSVTVNGPVTITQNTGGGGLVWGNVSNPTWMSLGWWSGLGLLAVVFIIIAIVQRRRFDLDRLPRAVVIAACMLFVLYAGYHAVNFSRELM